MIKSFKHKGLERLFIKGTASGVQADYATRITLMLDAIDVADQVNELDLPGFRLHRLKGVKRNLWSVRVSANWRITFEFENGDAYILDLEDYH
ncbi:type II toxin-antitoxin system RelE/ParE family toxin [Sideroxydans lithotrophicus]|uniref:Plasmid maintenance system killer n=1 Tax=Sideroxydans lithotrophicus (strain ES-1) TaxID=580332 RepID=D5CUN5_SIDLE|nr:type II toxin-antitoxin system RelE/ParE family toxin [Sideroxydans lithotrophicus]ADE12422.1 plasmid maintenance system killer [Sideroxydans lithotrophicus ES-1]